MTAVDRLSGIHSGLGVKAPVRVATTANITLSGTQTIDGVAVTADERVLVKDQSTASENGIYVVSTGLWTRATDFDGTNDVVEGTAIVVAAGTTNAQKIFHLTTDNPITLGTTSLSFSALSASVTPGANTVSTSTIQDDAVTLDKLVNASAQYKVLARKTAAAGNWEECSLSEVLDFVTSPAQGDLLYRGAATWERLGAGTAGQFLQTGGAAANPAWASQTSALPRSYLAGLTLSNNGSDATNDIDIAVGSARDSTNAVDITLAASLTKRLDANWAVGTNQGGLDTGAIANALYYIWLIKRSDTGVVDVLFSTSATAPTMPTSYDYKRRIGSIRRSGATILPFQQTGDIFLYKTTILDFNTNVGTSRSLATLTAPPSMVAKVRVVGNNAAGAVAFLVTPTYETDAAPAPTAVPGITFTNPAASVNAAIELDIYADTSIQIALRASAATSPMTVLTRGWIDRRGRDD
jgi:hypothetical protein